MFRSQEIERATRLLAKGESPEAVMEQLARSLTQKYLHGTLTALNQGEDSDREHLLALIPRIFPSGNERR